MPNKKISQLDVRSSPTLADLLAIADPSTGYAYKITGTNLQTVLEIPNKVPYTGATANVNLGAYNITATNIIRAGGLATQFLKADGSVDITTYMNRAVYDTDGNGVVDAAEKMQTIGRNSTGVTLYKGTIVYISGSTGNRPNFVKAQANSEATSAGTFGVVVSDIANNADGYVATIGTLADLDTRTTATNPFTSVTLADGDTLYLDPNTAGYVTNVKPSAPNHIVYVGKVVRTSPTLGTIVYRIQNGYELNEIHDVAISSVSNNDVLVYETATTLWKNKSIATILGYTPISLTSLSASAPISYNNTTGVFSIAQATGSINGFLSSTDWTTFNNKQAAITLTTTGSSGASTFVSNTLNIPTYTLAGLGGQPQLNGTGFVKATGTTISYDNTNYATDSLVVHLAGSETITGVKTFQNALQTTTGNNLLNTGGGNTVIGYTADPASSANYKLDVNGKIKSNTLFVNDGSAYSLTFNSSATNGQLLLKGSYPSLMLQNDLGANRLNVFNGGPNAGIQIWYGGTSNIYLDSNAAGYYALNFAFGKSSAPVASAVLELSSVSQGLLLPRMTTAQKTAITTPATSLMVYDTDLAAFQYYTGSAWAGLGGGITGSGTAGQITYWSGTSAVTGSSNLFWDNTNGRLGIGTNAPLNYIDVVKSLNGAVNVRSYNTITGGGASAGFDAKSDSCEGGFFATSSTYANYGVLGPTMIGLYSNNSFSIMMDLSTAIFRIGIATTERLRMFSNGNLMLQNGGTFTDGGQRLQVIGSMRVGTTAASAMYWDDTNARLIIGNTSGTARLDIGASTTSASALRIRSGTAPTSPNDGDIWYDGTNIYIRVGTTTKTFTIL